MLTIVSKVQLTNLTFLCGRISILIIAQLKTIKGRAAKFITLVLLLFDL